MEGKYALTEGNIFSSLMRFAIPVLFAMFLQALYGGVDLLIVGRFAQTADVSGVATGSALMQTVTSVISGLTMGITILVGQRIGEKQPEKAGHAVGGGIVLFAVVAVLLTAVVGLGAEAFARFLHAPEEAFGQTVSYIRICGVGLSFIIAYNVLGGIFRGIGDSKTPLVTVAIACVLNIIGDLLFVAVFHMGAAGAALATVIAQAVSVLASLALIKKRDLPFKLSRRDIRFDKEVIGRELTLGAPIALQDLLVGVSFLVIQAIVNSISMTASAGVGVAEKICMFIMLVPISYMQSMSAFVAQNMGAEKPERAKKALGYGIATAFAACALMGAFTFFRGDLLSLVFARDAAVVAASHDYLKAYAIDCLLVPILFCFAGYFNGCGKTTFVMLQGIIGAFAVRIPVVFFVSRIEGATLFHIGLGTPASTVVQIALCLALFINLARNVPLRSLPTVTDPRAE